MTTSNLPGTPHGRLAFVRRLLDEPLARPAPDADEDAEPGLRRLTAVEADPQRAGAVRLLVDNQRYATIAREDADGLRPGLPLTEALEQRIKAAADAEGALRSGLASLARRALAAGDLQRRLQRKGHDPLAAATAIERLARLGLLDDAAFAKTYAEQAGRKGRGPVRVSHDLARMGVDRETAQRAIGEAGLRESLSADSDTVRRLAESRLSRMRGLDAAAASRRLLGYLARRGFQGAEVNALVRRLVVARDRDGAADE